jgi:hypothetical protein
LRDGPFAGVGGRSKCAPPPTPSASTIPACATTLLFRQAVVLSGSGQNGRLEKATVSGMAPASASTLSTRLKAIRSLADDLSRELSRNARRRPGVTQVMASEISRLAGKALDMLPKRRR